MNKNQIKKPKDSDQLIYREIKERLRDQFESIDNMNTKAGIILGFDGAILTALLNSDWFRELPSFYLFIVLILICSVTGLALKAFLTEAYKKDPEPSKLIEKYQEETESRTLGQLTRNFEGCFNENKEKIEKKKKYLNWSLGLLALVVFSIAFITFVSSIKSENHMYNYKQEVTKCDRFKQ